MTISIYNKAAFPNEGNAGMNFYQYLIGQLLIGQANSSIPPTELAEKAIFIANEVLKLL